MSQLPTGEAVKSEGIPQLASAVRSEGIPQLASDSSNGNSRTHNKNSPAPSPATSRIGASRKVNASVKLYKNINFGAIRSAEKKVESVRAQEAKDFAIRLAELRKRRREQVEGAEKNSAFSSERPDEINKRKEEKVEVVTALETNKSSASNPASRTGEINKRKREEVGAGALETIKTSAFCSARPGEIYERKRDEQEVNSVEYMNNSVTSQMTEPVDRNRPQVGAVKTMENRNLA